MQPQTLDRNVVTKGELERGNFQISFDDQEFLMRILRDTLYGDKVLAVLREYSANAWDAHVEAGIPDRPIQVQLPTELEPVLKIRDFGLGLSKEEVFTLFTMYGKSTKRDSDTKVGLYGIGCKSGFAYGDSFTVTSWNGGMKRVYVASLDKDDMGDMILLYEEECGDETGIEISIAVDPHDVPRFQQRAANLFPFYFPFPEINDETIEQIPVEEMMENGYLGGIGTWGWVAIMGCIPYRIDLDQIDAELEVEDLEAFTEGKRGGLFFDIGEIKISASREALEYKEQTRKAIVQKFKDLREEVATNLALDLKGNRYSNFEKRVKALEALTWGIAPPLGYGKYTVSQIPIAGMYGRTWKLVQKTHRKHYTTVDEKFPVSEKSRMIIRDSTHALSGYSITHADLIVTPLAGGSFPEATEELIEDIQAFLVAYQLDGIPVLKVSEIDWDDSRVSQSGGSGGRSLRKHRVNRFVLESNPESRYNFGHGRKSDYWKIETDRDPTDQDVFVIISRFEGVGFQNFYETYQKDRELLTALGMTMPEVYGYKTTEKTPLGERDCEGIHYKKWREQIAHQVLRKNPTFKKAIRACQWASVFSGVHTYRWQYNGGWEAIEEYITKHYPDSHPLGHIFRKRRWGINAWTKIRGDEKFTLNANQLDFLYKITRSDRHLPDPVVKLQELYKRYPLLSSRNGTQGWEVWFEETREHWKAYVDMVDQLETNTHE